MKAPIFVVCENGDLLVFDSPERASSWLESPDVEAGEYVSAYDAEGRRVLLGVAEPTKRRGWIIVPTPVTVRAAEDEPSAADDLRRILALNLQGAAADTPLKELVERARRDLKVL